MKQNLLLIVLISLFLVNCNSAQPISQEEFLVQIETLNLTNTPNIHSYSWGKASDGKWLIIGGRIDGLHQMRPFEAFRKNKNNTKVFVIDPINNKTWSSDLNVLPSSIFEQLQSTNQQFHQRDNYLYILGGYGYSETRGDHITYPNLSSLEVDGLVNAVINDKEITSFFRQLTNDNLAVTGGQLGYLNNDFYLCGGQYFEGRYNPMGPNHGPGFIQEYTNEIRTFKINDNGTDLSISDYHAIKDEENLHRRDYNMVPQIFPDTSQGFTMFSGVFQYKANIPWLNSVDIKSSGYKVNNTFKQYLSQYHSAKVPIYNSDKNEMSTVFFGGLSQYHFNENSELMKDDEVPFVKTISMVTRYKDGRMTEKDLGVKMPAFLGAGAEFIPISDETIYLENDILDYSKLEKGSNLIGYIFGGIESSQENIFFNNNGEKSVASNRVFKVFIIKK